MEEVIQNNRESLRPNWTILKEILPDNKQGKPNPQIFKPYANGTIIELEQNVSYLSDKTLQQCIQSRKSIRQYSEKPITIAELSYLFFQSAKIHEFTDNWSKCVFPTPGATHSLEAYVVVTNVENLENGLYRYLPEQGNLEYIKPIDLEEFNRSIHRQLRGSGATFLWTAIPYRTEYKYLHTAHKMIAMEAGHACQNLYLASEALTLGCCAIGSYQQSTIDQLLGFDGEDEFVIYLATVGHKQ